MRIKSLIPNHMCQFAMISLMCLTLEYTVRKFESIHFIVQ